MFIHTCTLQQCFPDQQLTCLFVKIPDQQVLRAICNAAMVHQGSEYPIFSNFYLLQMLPCTLKLKRNVSRVLHKVISIFNNINLRIVK